MVYAAANANTNGTKSFSVTIPIGSANPEVDIIKLGQTIVVAKINSCKC
jgi:hypothetical protein